MCSACTSVSKSMACGCVPHFASDYHRSDDRHPQAEETQQRVSTQRQHQSANGGATAPAYLVAHGG